jgi:hypothetical protein
MSKKITVKYFDDTYIYNMGAEYRGDSIKNRTLKRRRLIHISKIVNDIYEWEFGRWPYYGKDHWMEKLITEHEHLRIELEDENSEWWNSYHFKYESGFDDVVMPFCGQE